MGVNICALSCDMGYEADSPDFICGELHCWTTVFLKSVQVCVCVCVNVREHSIHMTNLFQRDVVLF